MKSAVLVKDSESSEFIAVVLNLGCILWNHTGKFNTHTHTNHTRKFITHTQETWVCPRDSDFTSLWDIARVLRFCSAAEIEKD